MEVPQEFAVLRDLAAGIPMIWDQELATALVRHEAGSRDIPSEGRSEDGSVEHAWGLLGKRLAALDKALTKEFPEPKSVSSSPWEQAEARDLLKGLERSYLTDLVFGLDYLIEVRKTGPMISPEQNEHVLYLLVSVAGWPDALARENSGHGYHFHYVFAQGRPERSNVLLTFNPSEPVGPPDTLFWERHGRGTPVEPNRWGAKRTRAIYSATMPSLIKPGKRAFRRPSRDANVLLR